MLQPLYIIYMDMTGVREFSHSVNCPPQIFVTGRASKPVKMSAFLKAFLKYCKSFLHLADNTGILWKHLLVHSHGQVTAQTAAQSGREPQGPKEACTTTEHGAKDWSVIPRHKHKPMYFKIIDFTLQSFWLERISCHKKHNFRRLKIKYSVDVKLKSPLILTNTSLSHNVDCTMVKTSLQIICWQENPRKCLFFSTTGI